MSERFYITTAISYPNGRPHIGHAYEAIATDAIARFQRGMGRDVFFMTGTDEHGLKMAQTARDRGVDVADLATEMSGYFRQMDDALNISYDRFIRTTEPDHHVASQAIWQAMEANGDLYLGRYEGWYSVRDEAFYDEKELIFGEDGAKLSPQNTPVEWTVEESWFFRLSAYQERLLALFQDQPDFIRPESRRNEMIAFVSGGLSDLSISRTSFDWGVKVPGSDGHVMYVWVDALTNYLTGTCYPDPAYVERWPADVHVIGKDIVRFHTVYWPAFLMSAGIALPRQVFGHGFLLNRGQKESKSLGNVTDPLDLAERFGVDALRYFLLAEVSFGNDGSYSPEAIVTRANADLSNSFGNLGQRVLSLISKNLDGALPALGDAADPAGQLADDDRNLLDEVAARCGEFQEQFAKLALSQGIEAWLRAVFACNQYVDAQAPWALKKTDPERMKLVLGTLFVAIRDLAICIAPVVPGASEHLLDQMRIDVAGRRYAVIGANLDWYRRMVDAGTTVEKPVPIFPRVEMPMDAQ